MLPSLLVTVTVALDMSVMLVVEPVTAKLRDMVLRSVVRNEAFGILREPF